MGFEVSFQSSYLSLTLLQPLDSAERIRYVDSQRCSEPLADISSKVYLIMSDWETGPADEAAPLENTTNVVKVMAAREPGDQEAAQHAAKKGWAKPTATKYNHDEPETEPEFKDEVARGQPQYATNFAKYEWQEEYGEVGPEIPELEEALFRSQHRVQTGIKFNE